MCFEIRFISTNWESEAMPNIVHNRIPKSKVFYVRFAETNIGGVDSCESILRQIGNDGYV